MASATPEQVWKKFQEQLGGYIQNQVRDPHASAEIMQEVFLKMQAGLQQLREQEKAAPWLFAIARSAIADYFRQAQRERRAAEAPGRPQPAEEQPEHLTREFAYCIGPFIDSLPPKYAEALQLVEIEGISQKELAHRLGISYSGARSRVQRGRELLKAALLQCCAIETDAYGNIIDYQKK